MAARTEQAAPAIIRSFRDAPLNIIRLLCGEQASYFADRIHVWRTVSGDHRWSGALISLGDAAFASGKGFAIRADAEAAAISWAQEYDVRVLYIQRGAQ